MTKSSSAADPSCAEPARSRSAPCWRLRSSAARSAAAMKMRISSSQQNDPKFANGRVYFDNLMKHIKAGGLSEQVEPSFFPDNQLGQEIDVINSVKLGVIDMMISGSSISANLVPIVGAFDLGYLFDCIPAADQGLRGRRRQADRGGAAQGRQHPHHRVGLQLRLAQRARQEGREDAGGPQPG